MPEVSNRDDFAIATQAEVDAGNIRMVGILEGTPNSPRLISPSLIGGGGGGVSFAGTLDVNARGGVAGGVVVTATLNALITDARDDFPSNAGTPLAGNHVGPMLIGHGIAVMEAPGGVLTSIDGKNANVDFSTMKLIAPAGASGTMVTLGRSNPGGTLDNMSIATPNIQRWTTWGGNRITGINSAITAFVLTDDQAPGAVYALDASYVGNALRVAGNTETKSVTLTCAYVDDAVIVEQTASGSADTLEIAMVARQFKRLVTLPYTASGADLSVRFAGLAEGHVASVGDPNVISDANGKISTYDLQCRTYNGQGTGSFYHFQQLANDYADSVRFGGVSQHVHFYGRALNMLCVRSPEGTFRLRECFDGRAWTGAAADGAAVPCEAVFIGRVINGGSFNLHLTNIENSLGAVIFGSATHYSIGCDFGQTVVSCGAFKPFNDEYPRDKIGVVIARAVNCSFPIRQLHGQLIIRKDVIDCSISVRSTWARIRYPATFEAGGVWTLVIEGSLTWAEALACPWLAQVSGEQRVLFQSISDRGGLPHAYSASGWEMAGAHRASLLSMQVSDSDLNRHFKRPGVANGCPDNGIGYVARGDGQWRGSDASLIAPARIATASAYFARLGTALSAAHENIIGRLLWQLGEIGAAGAAVGAWWMASGTEEAALKAILPSAATAGWHDLVKSGAPSFTATQGFAMNPDTADALATGYNMVTAAEGLGLNDLLLLVGCRRDNPAYAGSDNGFDISAANGKAKLRDRDSAEQLSIGTTSTTAFPIGTSRMPDVIMAGRVSAGYQFGVSQGRVVATGAVTSAGGSGGMPDAISLAGSREIFAAGIFKASHFFTEAGGVISPIGDRPLILHRAFAEALAAAEAI